MPLPRVIAASIVTGAAFMAIGGSAADAASPVGVAADRLFARGGLVTVPVICRQASCRGSISTGGRRRFFGLGQGGSTSVKLPVPSRASRIRLTLRYRKRLDRVVLPVLHRPDLFRCGYGRTAAVLAAESGARILAVSFDTTDGTEASAVACLAGRSVEIAESYNSSGSGGGRSFEKPVLSARWAAVNDIYNDRGDIYPIIQLARIPDGQRRTVYLDTQNGPRLERYVVTDSGAIVATQRDPCSGLITVRAVDRAGERLVDTEPGVDPASLRVTGDTVTWTREGQPQALTLDGAPTRETPDIPPFPVC